MYLQQLARVKRWYKRIRREGKAQLLYEDQVWSFFQNCWHLKDWIKNDATAPSALRDNVEHDAILYDSLKLSADVANASKHYTLTSKRLGGQLRADVNVKLGGPKAIVRFVYYVVDSQNRRYEVLALAKKAIEDWQSLITKRGAPIA